MLPGTRRTTERPTTQGVNDGSVRNTRCSPTRRQKRQHASYKVPGYTMQQSLVKDSCQRHVTQRCEVCLDAASGMYFGAMVCLPCKSFFIRCTKDGDPKLTCVEKGTCDITGSNRLRCQFCRYRKCLSVGMCRKEKPDVIEPEDGQELCKVCGDIANGIHFGVFTCEGCKKFFRRALKEYFTFFCKLQNQCSLTPRNRNACRFCRYKKCQSVGMSRNAIKMGRPKKKLGDQFTGKSYVSSAEFDANKVNMATIKKSTFQTNTNSDTNNNSTTRGTTIEKVAACSKADAQDHDTTMGDHHDSTSQDITQHHGFDYDSLSESSDSASSSCSCSKDTQVDIEEDLDNILTSLNQCDETSVYSTHKNAISLNMGHFPDSRYSHFDSEVISNVNYSLVQPESANTGSDVGMSQTSSHNLQHYNRQENTQNTQGNYDFINALSNTTQRFTDHLFAEENEMKMNLGENVQFHSLNSFQLPSAYSQMYDSVMTVYDM